MVIHPDKLVKKFSIFNFQFSNRSHGFTLIELLVVISIMAILTSLGIASYATYNSNQLVQIAAADVVNLMNTAKSRAISQVKPEECGERSLTEYKVTIDRTQSEYALVAVCDEDVVIGTKSLPTQISFMPESDSEVAFALSTGISPQESLIKLTGFDTTKVITITETGTIALDDEQ